MATWNESAHNAFTEILVTDPKKVDYAALYEMGDYATMANYAFDELKDTTQDIVDLLVRKQRDYGHANILRFGKDGVLVRLWDKVARYNNLTARGYNANFESIDDTLRDIIGYVVILKMLENGTFTNEVE